MDQENARKERKTLYPFETLDLGARFPVPPGKYNSLKVSCVYRGRRLGRKFSIRTLGQSAYVYRVA